MMNKLASVDIGTNSMRLMLCEVNGRKIVKRDKELIMTRIGKNVSKSGMLSEAAISTNIQALKYFKNRAEKFGAEQIVAIATSAVRDAANGEAFVQKAKEEAGVNVRIIPGEEEAELGITGVMSEIEDESQRVLVIDVGGGSTELILGTGKNIEYSVSLKAGTVRMTESFVSRNPIPAEDAENLRKNLEQIFSSPLEFLKTKKIDKIIAIGGTATTLAAMYHELGIYNPDVVHNTVLDLKFLEETFEVLSKMSMEERYAVKGLQRERADVIPAGQKILIHIMESLGIDTVTISENDNLEGAVIKYCLQ